MAGRTVRGATLPLRCHTAITEIHDGGPQEKREMLDFGLRLIIGPKNNFPCITVDGVLL